MLPTVDRLRECLSLEAETGILRRRPRSRAEFSSDRAYAVWLSRFCNQEVGCRRPDGYLVVRVDGVLLRYHVVVWALAYGHYPPAVLDHRNGILHDNRLENLRLATASQNNMNKRPQVGTASGVKGVARNGEGWLAYINQNGRRVCLGTFDSIEQGADARRRAASRLHGEYAQH